MRGSHHVFNEKEVKLFQNYPWEPTLSAALVYDACSGNFVLISQAKVFKADDEIDVKFLNPLHSNTAFFCWKMWGSFVESSSYLKQKIAQMI